MQTNRLELLQTFSSARMGFIIYKYEARECWVQRVQLQPAADATNQDNLRCATRQWPVLKWKPPSVPESLLEIRWGQGQTLMRNPPAYCTKLCRQN